MARRLAPHLRRHWAGYAIVALAAAGYFFGLSDPGLWLDETYSAAFAALPWQALFRNMIYADGQFIVYYALMHFWTLLGDGEFWLRTPSVLAALVALCATYALGRRLFGAWAGAAAAAFLAANPLFIALAREARPYTIAIALVTLSGLVFFVADRRRVWAAYAAAVIAAAYAHLFAAFVVLAHAAYVAISRGDADRRRFVAAFVAFAAAIVPIVWITLHGDPSHLAWIPPTTPGNIIGSIVALAGLPQLAGVDAILLILAIVAGRRAGTAGDRFVWCWLVVPIVTAVVLSFMRPMLIVRYLAIVLPAACILFARGLCAIELLPARLAMAAIVIVLEAANPHSGEVPAEDWRGAVAYVCGAADVRRDGLIAFPGYVGVPILYYQRRDCAQLQFAYPRDDPAEQGPAPLAYVDFAAMASGHERLWLMLRSDEPGDPVKFLTRQLGEGYQLSEQRLFRGVGVVLWERRSQRD